MGKTNIPTLASVAEAEADEKKRGRLARALGAIASALNIGAADAKMTKKTLTTKRVEMEESDDSEEEESVASTERSSGAESSEASSSAKSSEEEEEEEEAAASEEKHAKYEEEEEEARAVAKGWKAAIKAYAEATRGVDAYGVKGPKGLLRAAEKATGKVGVSAVLSSLHGHRASKATADAKVIRRLAKVEAKATKVENENREERVNRMVADAKASGKAPRGEFRKYLRAFGAEHGTKKLEALIASLPQAVRTTDEGERIPHIDGRGSPLGAPTAQQQVTEMAMADLDPEQRKTYEKTRAEIAAKKANGAAKVEGY